jgi:hypothetical protein
MACLLRCALACISIVEWSGALHAETRVWTDNTGKFKVSAELVESKNGSVRLRQADGKIVTIPLARLSQADQEFLSGSKSPSSLTPPLGAVVRIVAPLADASAPEVQIVGCAIRLAEGTEPTVVSSRMLLRQGLDAGIVDAGLARAQFFDLRAPKVVGTARRLGFPGPQGHVLSGWEDMAIVLPASEGAKMPTLMLANGNPAKGDVVRLPVLPPPRREGSQTAALPRIDWTKWTVVDLTQSGVYVAPQDGRFPSVGGVPMVNSRNEVVGIYTAKAVLGQENRAVGEGTPAAVIRAAVEKAGKGASNAGGAVVQRKLPPLPPVSTGPIDASAGWRHSYEALIETISTKKDAGGHWNIDWGEAADLGAWYERRRVIGPQKMEAMRNPGRQQQIFAQLERLEEEEERAAARLTGVEWTAVAQMVFASSKVSSKFELAPLPEPLKMSFWVEEGDEQAWSGVQKGDRVRFECRFTSMAMGDEPGIDVRVRFKEIVKP